MDKFGIIAAGRPTHAASKDGAFFSSLNQALLDKSPVAPGIAGSVFVGESLNNDQLAQINTASSNLQATLSSVLQQVGMAEKTPVFAAESAAVIGALAAASPRQFLNRDTTFAPAQSANVFAIPAQGAPDYLGHRTNLLASEAFDNRETRSAVLYTMAYNYSVSRQDVFGETIWPTLTLPADQVGYGIVVNRLAVHRGVTHTVDGKVVEFKKIDLMRAQADHTILLKNKTRVYPIARAANAARLVDATVIAPYDFDNEGVVIKTAPYRVGVDCGIMGMSQSDAMLDGGSANQTDTLDPAISLEKVYVKVGDDVLAFNVYGLPGANFTYAPQGMDKQRNLTFRNRAVAITKDSLRFDKSALSTLGVVKTSELTVILELALSGEMNTEYGSATVFGNRVALVRVVDKDGNILPSTSVEVQDIAAALGTAQILGYDLRAFRTNINMRERGDFIDRTSFTQLYEVPLLSPITAQRPQNTDGQLDSGDFEALVTTTRFRMMNDAVTAIFESVQSIADYAAANMGVDVRSDDIPSHLGASRFHVKPMIINPDPIDVRTIVDSTKSMERIKDLQAAIVNIIRDAAFNLNVGSEYPAAMAALGMTGPATITIATDPILEKYIFVDGDVRTLTDKFNVRVVSTLDRRFKGKVFITFGIFDENRNQAPNLANWGNLIWAPEVVLSASVPRGESMSRETIVQPRYRFVMNMPVCAMLEFTNIPELLGNKLPIAFDAV